MENILENMEKKHQRLRALDSQGLEVFQEQKNETEITKLQNHKIPRSMPQPLQQLLPKFGTSDQGGAFAYIANWWWR